MEVWTESPAGSGAYVFNGATAPGVPLASTYLAATTPRRALLWVYRDEVPVDVLRILRRPYALGSKGSVAIMAAPLMSYFDRRVLTQNLNYTNQDQLAIARALVTWAQAVAHGDVGIEVGSETSGVLRTYAPIAYGYERRKIGELIAELANQEGGFDYGITVSLIADVPTATFQCWYPHRGRRFTDTKLTLGRNLLDFGVDEDGTESAVRWHGVGPGEGTDMLTSTSVDTSLIDAGYPLDEETISLGGGGVTQGDLNRATSAHRLRNSATAERWSLLVNPNDASTGFGTWQLGDEVKVIVEAGHPRFPDGIELIVRIVEQDIAPNNDGGPEHIELTAEVPVYV